jgi:hypothetical protein
MAAQIPKADRSLGLNFRFFIPDIGVLDKIVLDEVCAFHANFYSLRKTGLFGET